MHIYLQKKFVSLLFIAAMCILLFSSILVYQQIYHLILANSWVTHTHTVIEKINCILLDVVDSDRLEDDYINTNSPVYLQKIIASAKKITTKLGEIRQLTSDNPTQQARLDKLDPLIKARLAESDKIIHTFQPTAEPPLKN